MDIEYDNKPELFPLKSLKSGDHFMFMDNLYRIIEQDIDAARECRIGYAIWVLDETNSIITYFERDTPVIPVNTKNEGDLQMKQYDLWKSKFIKAGDRFGEWEIVDGERIVEDWKVKFKCRCSLCDSECMVLWASLRDGKSLRCKKCSLQLRKGTKQPKKYTIEKSTSSRLYKKWSSMIQRCKPRNVRSTKNYGDVGIRVCEEWLLFENFMKWALENGYRDDLTIDRIRSQDNYEPINCRWVTQQQNNCNRRSSKNSSSKYKGVFWVKKDKKWKAQIKHEGKTYYLGMFDSEIEAAKTYNQSAIELHGDFAYLNEIECI